MTPSRTQFTIPVQPEDVVFVPDPKQKNLQIVHAYPRIIDFPSGQIPDKVNPRSHEKLQPKMVDVIAESLRENPEWFHLNNRGLTILAEKVHYDQHAKELTVTLTSEDIHGMVDGATTDRTIARLKSEVPEFGKIKEMELPDFFRKANLHIEILVGDLDDMLVQLSSARNTSVQVKDFALEDLGGGFGWLKTILESPSSEFRNRIQYRQNEPERPVNVMTVLGLLTLFHPLWATEKREPVPVYTNKGTILDYFRDEQWKPGYRQLSPVVLDILRLYDFIHVQFPTKYEQYKTEQGERSKLGNRREVGFKEKGVYTLPLTQQTVQYLIPDGWLYPILAAHRMLLEFNDEASWTMNPQTMFNNIGASLVADVVESSDAVGGSVVIVGRNRTLWSSLRKSVEMKRLDPGEPVAEPLPAEPKKRGRRKKAA